MAGVVDEIRVERGGSRTRSLLLPLLPIDSLLGGNLGSARETSSDVDDGSPEIRMDLPSEGVVGSQDMVFSGDSRRDRESKDV
jgi:hypothetical protein